ncbi:hypothetical protein M988_1759 [Hafnia paralvei ATCC 29927]|uniref:DUF6392 family protein n=1 Tax=Hafnia paralvei TaxID=546367 RepID=UPI0007E30B3E|nr:DUF6392 family protein [Hafnia paralvei]MCE9903425.1 DUF6392 family protein [Hafnia paralvei]MCE9921722.1 DUF6392 family protein [Hafnia paralvei]OAT41776.1 hypothetical protein M988_1759 [Hafnia paralvei ATCC 29927]
MTVNVEALIRSIGKGYQEIFYSGLIPYKTKPKGASGSPNLSLEMAKEGIFLSFKREGQILKGITLKIQHEPVKNWIFPNELPSPLQKNMSRRWVHDTFGAPDKSVPPKVVMKTVFGWVDRFTVEDFDIPITMQIRYDMDDMVEAVTFIPTSELRW